MTTAKADLQHGKCFDRLKYESIKDLDDYLSAVYKHGICTYKADNRAGLLEIGVGCTVSHTIGPDEIEDEIDEGRPEVVIGTKGCIGSLLGSPITSVFMAIAVILATARSLWTP